MKRSILIFLLIFGTILTARAQFYTNGCESWNVRWQFIDSPSFRIIYPRGCDSLAQSYASELERYRLSCGLSLGMAPNQRYKRPMSVVIHPYYGYSNASVAWAPRRMDIYSTPSSLRPEPIPWVSNIALHESRHVGQMQYGKTRVIKPFYWLLGEMTVGAFSAVYPGPHLLEGDAVVAETGLSGSGRGRNAEFLEYYMAAAEEGDKRNWHKWRYGSMRNYTPDHYRVGYLTIAGTRHFYDDPLYSQRYMDGVVRRPWRLGNMQRNVKMASGKPFRKTFPEILDNVHREWLEGRSEWGPFLSAEQLTPSTSWYTAYSGLTAAPDNGLYGYSSGIRQARSLVKIDSSGKVVKIRPFSASATPLKADTKGRLWWSEIISDKRWEMNSTSRLCHMDPGSKKIHILKAVGYNPVPSPDAEKVAAVVYPPKGGSKIVVYDAVGNEISSWTAPADLQVYEVCWIPEGFAFAALSTEGEGLYTLCGGKLQKILEPSPVTIAELSMHGGKLHFMSDRTGAQELYRIDLQDGTVSQISNSLMGGRDYVLVSDTLYFTSQKVKGRPIFKTGETGGKTVDFSVMANYPMAEKLSEQERALAGQKFGKTLDEMLQEQDVQTSAPRRYHRLGRSMSLHSWAPVGIRVNSVSDISFENLFQEASPGLTGFFQNRTGEFYGSMSYAWKRYSSSSPRRHTGHISLTYRGLYPIIEANLDFNDRNQYQYFRQRQIVTSADGMSLKSELVGAYMMSGVPSVNGKLKLYVPLNFSSGGWSRGLIPQISWSLSNDRYNKSVPVVSYTEALESDSGIENYHRAFSGYEKGRNVAMVQNLTASIRGYVFRPTATSCVYPSLGIGAEMGFNNQMGLSDLYASAGYAYLYGYLPGIVPQQGLRLSAMYQHQFKGSAIFADNIVNTCPRGFLTGDLLSYLGKSTDQMKVSADYAIPFRLGGEWTFLCPVAYVKNLCFTPHFDYTMMSMGRHIAEGGFYSAGFNFTFNLANLLWIPYDTEIGFSFDVNGGPSFKNIPNLGRTKFGFIFNINL